tara:strand:- start:206 stop:397 length:192 start_codon:yes stop_codon:yes gene_type:complete
MDAEAQKKWDAVEYFIHDLRLPEYIGKGDLIREVSTFTSAYRIGIVIDFEDDTWEFEIKKGSL